MMKIRILLCVVLLSSTAFASVLRRDEAPKECKSTANGADYMGTENVTKKGFNCQMWSSDSPQDHRYNNGGYYDAMFPDGSAASAVNYCRKLDGDMPWCYIDDPRSTERWERCDICNCETDISPKKECKETEKGREYRGTQSKTLSGKTCQAWSSQTPHSHRFFPEDECFKESQNYCRNLGGGEDAPWCYTTDPETTWELCDVCDCDRDAQNYCRNPSGSDMPWCYTTDPNKEWDYCDICMCDRDTSPKKECKDTDKGAEYRGTLNVTKSGKTCQAWSSQTPHTHDDYPKDECFEDSQNYCRNPSGDDGPWCYTTDPGTEWEYCDVCKCDEGTTPALECYNDEKGTDYRGTKSITISSLTCQSWSEQTPHEHSEFPKNECLKDAKNYCRNPSGSSRPWCYTINLDTVWEYCDTCPCNKWNAHACDGNPCGSGSSACEPRCGGGVKCICKPGYYGSKCQYCGQVKTENNKTCVFPFVSDGILFYDCTTATWSGKPWCSLTNNYDKDEKYGYCESVDSSQCPDGDAVAPPVDDWAAQILHGVTSVPALGTMVSLAVWGDDAQVIVTRPFTPENILMAAAEFKGARIIVFTGIQYTTKFLADNDPKMAKLISNMKDWLLKGSGNTAKVEDVSDKSNFNVNSATNIAVWDGSQKSSGFVSALKSWLGSGKGLVLAIDEDSVDEGTHTAVKGLLMEMGMSYKDDTWSSNNDIDAKTNRAKKAHLGSLLQESADHSHTIVNNKVIIGNYLDEDLPRGVINALRPKFDALFNTYKGRINFIPTDSNNTRDVGNDLAFLYDKFMLQNGFVSKAPGIDEFPYDFDSPPQLVKAEIEIKSHLSDWHATGYYLPAGQEATVKVLEKTGSKQNGWKVLVGVHTDELYDKTYLERWPKITQTFDLGDKTEMKFQSPFGGLIVLLSPSGGENSIKFTLKNVAVAPRYDITDPNSADQWMQRRNAPGMWSLFEGKYITVVLKSADIRNLVDPRPMLELWDEVVKEFYNFAGYTLGNHRREWMVPDTQISIGLSCGSTSMLYMIDFDCNSSLNICSYNNALCTWWDISNCEFDKHFDAAGAAHSGYPLMFGWDIAYMQNTTEPGQLGDIWGVLHEIGHNMQGGDWTLKGQTEVTNNMMALWMRFHFANQDPWQPGSVIMTDGQIEKVKKLLKDLGTGFSFNKYVANVWNALFVYAEIGENLGWYHTMKVLRVYNHGENAPDPDTDQAEIDEWVIQSSKVAGRDLRPCYEFWGWELTDKVGREVGNLTPYFFKDKATDEWAPERAAFIMERYPNAERTIEKLTVAPPLIPPIEAPSPRIKVTDQQNV